MTKAKLLGLPALALFASVAQAQLCGSGTLVPMPLGPSGSFTCKPATGAGTGTVTSVGLAGAANQIAITGASPITGSGSWTLSLPSGLIFPGLVTHAASTTGAASANFPSGVAPTTPNSGDFWNQSGVLHFYDGATNQSLLFQSRTVSTTAPLGGGGALTANLTFTCTTCTTNAAALTANQLVIGGGSQAAAALGSLGTTTTLLHGNAAGAPTFGNVADGDFGANLLGVAHGGTNLASGTSGGILGYTASGTLASSVALTANMPVIGGGAGATPTVGSVTGNTTQFATSTGTQTSTAVVKIDASGNHIASGVTIDGSNNVSTPGSLTSGAGSGNTGYTQWSGATSGSSGITVPNVAGTQSFLVFPNPSGGSNGQFLQLGASATCPTGVPGTCYTGSWATPTGSGTVVSATAGQLYYNAAGGATATGNANATISSGALTLGQAASVQGSLVLAGSAGGATTLAAQSSGGGTLTLPGGTDTIVGRATTDTLTSKSLNCFSGNTCIGPVIPTAITTSTPISVTTTNPNEFYWNQHATAATAITYNLPTAAAGLQFCFKNSYNGTAANTGAITINTSAAGQFIIDVDGSIGSTGGHIASGGAGGDGACVVGVDSTHWQVYVNKGTWTKN